MQIRPYQIYDWPAVWRMLEAVFRAGQTYAFDPKISEQQAQHIWLELPQVTYVAENETGELVGTYYLKPNQPALGSHVCNCGYIVSEHARGQGVASQMCLHSQKRARELGFSAMQYNLVVASNEVAVHTWEKHGFQIVGRLPKAFKPLNADYVDALVMYKWLAEPAAQKEAVTESAPKPEPKPYGKTPHV